MRAGGRMIAAFRWARQVRHGTFLAAGCALLLAGCGATVTFLGDPALYASLGDIARFESELTEAGRETGNAVEVLWDPSPELGASWLEAQLTRLHPEPVVLSPYFSLFAEDLSAEYPGRSFVSFYGSASANANLLRVEFDRETAFREAGGLAAAWEEAGANRLTAALFLTDSEGRRRELQALREGYGPASGRELTVTEFTSAPEREDMSRAVRELLARGVNGFMVFAGTSNRFALEQLRAEPVVFATVHGVFSAARNDALLFSIEHPLARGMAAALRLLQQGESGGLVTVDAVVVIGEGYDRPQLAAARPGSAAD